MKTLLISLNGALTRLELWPGELFDLSRYDIMGLSNQEYLAHDKHWSDYDLCICVMNFSFAMHDPLDLSLFDIVFVLNEESIEGDPSQYRLDMIKKFNNDRLFFIASAHDTRFSIHTEHFYLLPFFCLRVPTFNRCPITSTSVRRDRVFDALLGMKKPHRDWIFYRLARENMLPNCLVNYTTSRWEDPHLRTIYRSPELNNTDGEELCQGVFDSYASITNRGAMLSHIVPWPVYARSWYSIVAETDFTNHCFVSEKTAKCFFAGRVFVMFAAPGLLEHCRRLGFRTFDHIFDETYDSIQDPLQRWEAAFEQVIWLSKQIPRSIIHRAQEVLDHNSRHICNRDYFTDPMMKWINDRVRRISNH